MAQWLDTACYAFDHAILKAIHSFTVATGGFFDFFMKFISFLGEEGICLILFGLLLFCFKKTKRQGACILFSIACGAVITNVLLKNIVARPRPFADEARVFFDWWQYIGAPHAGKNSFPSGHTTSAMAAMTALFLTTNKKYSWTAFVFAILMGLSRMYLMVHYPTDVLGGLIAGALGAIGGYFLSRWILSVCQRHTDKAFIRFVMCFDLAVLLRRLFHRQAATEIAQASPKAGYESAASAEEGDGNSKI